MIWQYLFHGKNDDHWNKDFDLICFAYRSCIDVDRRQDYTVDRILRKTKQVYLNNVTDEIDLNLLNHYHYKSQLFSK